MLEFDEELLVGGCVLEVLAVHKSVVAGKASYYLGLSDLEEIEVNVHVSHEKKWSQVQGPLHSASELLQASCCSFLRVEYQLEVAPEGLPTRTCLVCDILAQPHRLRPPRRIQLFS